MAEQKNKINYISFLYVLSAFAVVILHANVAFWVDVSKPYWQFSNVIESVFYFAVPVFFMLTGATLIDYNQRYSTKEFFKKRFVKVGIPFIFWSVFAFFWYYRKTFKAMILGEPNEGLKLKFHEVLNYLVNAKYKDIYWFFIPLFCIYLIIPLFAHVQQEKKVKIFSYIVLVALPINFVVPAVLALLKRYKQIDFGWSYGIYVASAYLYYVLIGYVFAKRDFKWWFRLIIYALAIWALFTHMLGTYNETKSYGFKSVVNFYKGYYNLPCILYSPGIFLFVKQAASKIKSPRVNGVFSWLQKFTFPIYLMHRYFLDFFEDMLPKINVDRASFLYFSCATVLAIGLSIALTLILRLIPGVRKVVP